MRTIGFFAELGPNRPDIYTGSIRDAIRGSAADDEDALVGYLNSGSPLVDIMEATPDVISRDRYVPGGSSILGDGVWVWRQDLPYYVQRYHLDLEPDFVRHVRDSGFRVALPDPQTLDDLAETVLRDLLRMS